MGGSINRWFATALGVAFLTGPAIARDRSKPPVPAESPGAWFNNEDYPATARRANEQGRVAVELAIDALGSVTGCTVTASSGSASLDAKTCELVTLRGKFKPRLDKDGKAVPSTYPISTRWVLQGDAQQTLTGSWRAAAVASIDPSGKVVSCKGQNSGVLPQGAIDLCSGASTMSAANGIYLRGGTAPGLVDVTAETSSNIDGDIAPTMVFEGENRVLLAVKVFHLDVDASGKAQNCQILIQSGPETANPCDPLPGPFKPADKPRGVTVKYAMSRRVGE